MMLPIVSIFKNFSKFFEFLILEKFKKIKYGSRALWTPLLEMGRKIGANPLPLPAYDPNAVRTDINFALLDKDDGYC